MIAGSRMIGEANHWLGISYLYGGATRTTGVDCSGCLFGLTRALD